MLGSILQPRNYESHALNTKPRTLTYSQALARNDAENRCYEISIAADGDYSKRVISFAS